MEANRQDDKDVVFTLATSTLEPGLHPRRQESTVSLAIAADNVKQGHQGQGQGQGQGHVKHPREFPGNEVKFFCQIFIIFIIVCVSLYNLTSNTGNTNDTLWISLLSSSMGYLMPNPSIRRRRDI